MKDFYRKLNKSAAGEYTRRLWSDYRKTVTDFALDGFNEGKSTLIIAAGNMNDIDFPRIKECSDNITLADIDTESVNDSIPDIGAVSIDFGGLNLPKGVSEDEIIGMLELHEPNIRDELGENTFDNILVSPFYSQILLPWIFNEYPYLASDSPLAVKALDSAGQIIIQANRRIKSLCRQNTHICIWSDILEYDIGDEAFHDISKNIDDNEWMDSFYWSYLDTYGHGTGSFGHMDMERKMKNIRCRWIIWPFDERRRMIVRIASGRIADAIL